MAQIVSSDCTVPEELKEAYDRDVKGIAIKRMQVFNSPDIHDVIIPEHWQDTIWAGLAAIYNAANFPERDSVFNLYCVHDFGGSLMVGGIVVGFTENADWADAWANGETLTGEPALDSIIQTYDLELVIGSYSQWGFAALSTSTNINVLALADLVEANVPDVAYCEPNYLSYIGGRIEYENIAGWQHFEFIHEWEWCVAGCNFYYSWKYRVAPDCTVHYLGSQAGGIEGPGPLPEPRNCNITDAANGILPQEVSLFPNPARETCEVKVAEIDGLILELYSGQGQLLHRQYLAESARLSLDHYIAGLYWVKVKDEKNRCRLLPLVKQ